MCHFKLDNSVKLTHALFMSDKTYWDRVKHGCEKLGIPDATFRTWKSRGCVSREKRIPLYQALAGTKYAISLDQIQKHQ